MWYGIVRSWEQHCRKWRKKNFRSNLKCVPVGIQYTMGIIKYWRGTGRVVMEIFKERFGKFPNCPVRHQKSYFSHLGNFPIGKMGTAPYYVCPHWWIQHLSTQIGIENDGGSFSSFNLLTFSRGESKYGDVFWGGVTFFIPIWVCTYLSKCT